MIGVRGSARAVFMKYTTKDKTREYVESLTDELF